MKQISSTLLAILENATAFNRVDLITIALPNGQEIVAADGADDVNWAGTYYSATQFGAWERGSVISSADFSLESNSMPLTVTADTNIFVPGTSTPLMSVVAKGFFDGCHVQVDTVYMPIGQWGLVVGALTLFTGFIVEGQRISRSKVEFTCRDWLHLLNLKVPLRVIQPSCFQTLFDTGCTLSQSSFALSNTVGAGSTQSSIVPASAWPTSDGHGNNPRNSPYFVQGKILWTSGQNKGLSSHISVQVSGATGNLTLQGSTMFPVATGDAFTAFAGCDKTFATCVNKFSNGVHYTGLPYVPPPEQSA